MRDAWRDDLLPTALRDRAQRMKIRFGLRSAISRTQPETTFWSLGSFSVSSLAGLLVNASNLLASSAKNRVWPLGVVEIGLRRQEWGKYPRHFRSVAVEIFPTHGAICLLEEPRSRSAARFNAGASPRNSFVSYSRPLPSRAMAKVSPDGQT
jgi:hypothetical protein